MKPRIIALLVLIIVVAGGGVWLVRDHQPATATPAAAGTWYIDQMHPWIISPTPGTCPICGMDLVPIDPKAFAGTIGIDPVMVQNMGIRTAAVERAAVERSVRTVGTVAIDEALVSDVNLKLAGWVERLQVDTLWAPVQAGQPLFDLYAPDLYAAQQEYLLALRNRDGPRGAELLAAARTRLRFLDIGDAAIDALAKAGVPSRTMTITAPRAGVVAVKNVNAGTYAMPGMTTMRIADLARVWIDAVVYEHQLDPALIRVGEEAQVTPALTAAQAIPARIDYVYPTIDPRLREVRVRLVVDNPEGLLKPGMFATVRIAETGAPELLVPAEAVVGTGERHVAFVALDDGRFAPRIVRLGRATDDGRVAVLDGLHQGERVVTSGEFLLDSETRMREGLAKVMAAGLAATPAAQVQPMADNALPPAAAAALPALIDAYLAVQAPLADDDATTARTAAAGLVAATRAFAAAADIAAPPIRRRAPEIDDMVAASAAMAAAGDLPTLRTAFGRFGAEMIGLARRAGVPPAYAARLHPFRCGMFKTAPDGGVWIQDGAGMRNPFLGQAMPDCGSALDPLPSAASSAPMSMPMPAAGTATPPAMPAGHHH